LDKLVQLPKGGAGATGGGIVRHSAMPPRNVTIKRPCGVVVSQVSHHFSQYFLAVFNT
jgi:hypothetical protein